MTAVIYRPAELGTHDEPGPDRKFVVDGWVATYRDAYTAGLIQVEDWYSIMIPQIGKVLARPDVRTVVAAVEGAAGGIADLLGFVVADTADYLALVYYVFVKEHYRRAGRGRLWDGPGIGRGLFGAIGVDPGKPFNYVCSTQMCRVLQRKIPLARWQPALGRFPKHERRSHR
jgi:hypothetical protein